MKEFNVKITVRNNLILKLIAESGLKNQSEFARWAGIPSTALSRFINLQDCPINSFGEFTTYAQRLMEALGACPSDLWTEQQLTLELNKNSRTVELSREDLICVLGANLSELIYFESPEEVAMKHEANEILRKTLNTLPKILPIGKTGKYNKQKGELVLKLRNGIDCDEHTLQEVAEQFGTTRERIRQIECRAVRQMRHPSRADKIQGAIDEHSYY